MIYRYIGDGAHYPGIPARDLSAEEAAALSPEQQADVYSGHVYRAEEEAEQAAPAAPVEEAPPAGEFAVAPPTSEPTQEPPAEGQAQG